MSCCMYRKKHLSYIIQPVLDECVCVFCCTGHVYLSADWTAKNRAKFYIENEAKVCLISYHKDSLFCAIEMDTLLLSLLSTAVIFCCLRLYYAPALPSLCDFALRLTVKMLHLTVGHSIIQRLTGAEVSTEKLCPEVVECCQRSEGPRVTLHNWGA